MRGNIGFHSVAAVILCAGGAGATPAPAPAPLKTPVHLDLPCPALNGSVGLDVDVKGEQAVLRVTYPGPFASYRGRGDGSIDTFVYFDSDNDMRSGLEEWDAESLKIKGVDYSVEVREDGDALDSNVFKHAGSMSTATGSFTSEYTTNGATFTVDLMELKATPGSVVRTLLMVGKCGPVAQTFQLGTAGPAVRAGASARGAGAKDAASAAAPSTPVSLDLPCPALEGSVGLDIDVKGDAVVLRVEYPRAFATYRGRSEGFIDTFVYFDSDNDIRSGLEEWDAESLKIKGADYSVAVREYPEANSPDAVNGHILHAKVFTHEGGMANATGEFTSEYLGNVAIFTVDLAELHMTRGSVVKAMFEVGKCGVAARTFRLAAASPAAKPRR
jgi:hypothetical protein